MIGTNLERRESSIMFVLRRVAQLGSRTLIALTAALIAALLIFEAPRVGFSGVSVGIVCAAVAAVLLWPHLHRHA